MKDRKHIQVIENERIKILAKLKLGIVYLWSNSKQVIR